MNLAKLVFSKVLLTLLTLLTTVVPGVAQISDTWWSESGTKGWPENYWVEEGVVFAISDHFDRLTLLSNAYRVGAETVFLSTDLRRLTVVEFAAGIAAGTIEDRIVVWAVPTDTGLPMAMKVQSARPGVRTTQRFARLEEDAQQRLLLRTVGPPRILIDEFGDAQGEPVVDFLGNVLQVEKLPEPGDRVCLLLHEGTVVRVKRLHDTVRSGSRLLVKVSARLEAPIPH